MQHWGIYTLAFIVPLATTAFLTPVAARMAHRFDVLDHPSSDRYHSRVTPYFGGLAVASGLIVVAGITAASDRQLLTTLGGATLLMVVGLLDDRFGVGPSVKLLAEVLAASLLWVAGVRGGLFGVPLLDYLLTVLWVVAITNSLNLIDNMDGLAAGVTAIGSITYFLIAAPAGTFLVASFALALAGASVGFLRHNFPPARIFLGDAGSLMLGFLLAALALKLDLVGESGFVRALIPILILGVPIFDTILVVITRMREHRPIFVGGTDHSSHRLTELGLSGRSVVLATYTAQAIMCGIAVLVVHVNNFVAVPVLIGVVAVAVYGLIRFLALGHSTSGGPGSISS